jgi:hypothetical protein
MLSLPSSPGDSSDQPTAKEIGKCSVQLCYRIDWDIIVVQELATHIDASRLSVQSPAIDGSLASDGEWLLGCLSISSQTLTRHSRIGSSYFIRIISDTLLDDSLDYKAHFAVYSGNFTLQGMSGKLPGLDTTTSVPTISASSSTTHSAVLALEATASQSGTSTDSSSTEVATSSTQSNNTASGTDISVLGSSSAAANTIGTFSLGKTAATGTTHSAAVLPITTSSCGEVHTTTGSIDGTDQVSTASNRNSASGCSSLVAVGFFLVYHD